MSNFQISLLNFALDTVAHFNPEYVPAITWLKAHESDAEKLIPVIDATIREGGAAIDAVKKQAPDLYKAIVDLVDASQAPQDTIALQQHAENAARTMFGFQRMTPAEEQAWMARFTPSGDSASGSG